jgi:nickel-dependent lactate racemase
MPAIQLSYGETGLRLDLDDARFASTVILPADPPAHADPRAAFAAAVARPFGARPLAELGRGLKPGAKVAIAIADHTRPVPDHLLVPWIVETLGVGDDQVVILIGTGTHRGSTPTELERMLGPAAKRFRIVNHDCQDAKELVLVGKSACGGECWLNRAWVEADCRIGTGFIEPHFFAGFSGGSKSIVPGIAGLKTVQHFHRSRLIAHPDTTWGDLRRNPLQALTREMTALCPPHFIVNVTLNLQKRITAVFAGETIAAHDAGCAMALHEAMQPVARRFPVVVTTNSGYPLDQNFYQTVKGISAASRIVERGGTIVVASRCNAGLPNEGEFRTLLCDPRPSGELLKAILANEKTPHDQWQVQTLLQCLEHADIVLHSSLPPADRALTRTRHTDDLGRTLDELRAKQGVARLPVAVLPMGPLTIPVLQAAAAH